MKKLNYFFSVLTIALLTACGGGGGGGSAPAPTPTPAPTPAPGPTRYYPSSIIVGKAIDGYLENATAWIDENFDFVQQDIEISSVTAEGGTFSFDATLK